MDEHTGLLKNMLLRVHRRGQEGEKKRYSSYSGLGDAAHAMTPNLGQGACQAIEDAIVLGSSLQNEADVVAGLKCYEMRRIKRVHTIVRLARLIGQVVQLENPLVSSGRDALMKRIPVNIQLQRLMWILDYEA
jgi:2-polyprenyl-6-methoxyphenol hydroxylase-like FAD-dependent oxidoreductase